MNIQTPPANCISSHFATRMMTVGRRLDVEISNDGEDMCGEREEKEKLASASDKDFQYVEYSTKCTYVQQVRAAKLFQML